LCVVSQRSTAQHRRFECRQDCEHPLARRAEGRAAPPTGLVNLRAHSTCNGDFVLRFAQLLLPPCVAPPGCCSLRHCCSHSVHRSLSVPTRPLTAPTMTSSELGAWDHSHSHCRLHARWAFCAPDRCAVSSCIGCPHPLCDDSLFSSDASCAVAHARVGMMLFVACACATC
jgi:hypothetical protein